MGTSLLDIGYNAGVDELLCSLGLSVFQWPEVYGNEGTIVSLRLFLSCFLVGPPGLEPGTDRL